MRYLLDTNVVSQLIKTTPQRGVIPWFEKQKEQSLFLSVATVLEVRTEIDLRPHGQKRIALEHWLKQDIQIRFAGRILAVDEEIAERCGRILARSQSEGWRMEPMDALIAATAMAHAMTLATLNRKHFEMLGVELVEF